MNNAITLYNLLNRIKNTIKKEYASKMWIISEISEMRSNNKGHYHFSLIEKKDDQIIAKTNGFMWKEIHDAVYEKFYTTTGVKLTPGLKLLLYVSINFSEAYGLNLIINDIDPSYTIGEMEQQKRITINTLKKEGIIDNNKKIPLGLPQRIAVISSETAAGYGDFVNHIVNNKHGYKYVLNLYKAVMQGTESITSIINALNRIKQKTKDYDAVVIIRGGGSTADLNCFDSYDMARAVALYPIPVITGIGHDRDRTVVDITAHTSLKTPTAVAEYLIDIFMRYEDKIDTAQRKLIDISIARMIKENSRINNVANNITRYSEKKLSYANNNLNRIEEIIKIKPLTYIERHYTNLNQYQQKIMLLSPRNVLKRGYSITYLNGKVIKSSESVKYGDIISTRYYEGTSKSKIINTAEKGGNND